MKVDIREKLKNDKMLRELSKDHRSVFERKLQSKLHKTVGSPKKYLMIAASVIILFSFGYLVSDAQQNQRERQEVQASKVSLEEFSPELKKIENYYLTAINFEMAGLEVTPENKFILDEYFRKLNALSNEYQLLNERLEINKIDEELINNLIDNLQMRLALMIELKDELKKLKSKKDEEYSI